MPIRRTNHHQAGLSSSYGDWRLHEDDVNRFLDLDLIENLITVDNIQTIALDQIAFKLHKDPDKRAENCPCCKGTRYKNCEVKIPTIISEGQRNPSNKPYVVLDGNHRIEKMNNQGVTQTKCFVVKHADTKQHYKPYY